jgi:putative membrane protein
MSTMRLLVTMAAMAVLLAAPAGAQSTKPAPGNPAGTAPLTPQVAPGMPAPHSLNQTDRLFIRQAALGGTAEVELAGLAQRAGQSDAVKSFAERMAQDHGKANERLAALAKEAGIAAPQGLDPEHQAMLDRLGKLSGAKLDRAYIQGQVQDHQKTAHLLEWEIGSGQNPELKRFASETLPVVLKHLRMAQDIAAKLAVQASKAP